MSHRHGFKSRSDDRLWRCGVTVYIEEASRSAKPSGRGAYGMPHAVRTTEADTQNNPWRHMLVDLILCET
eukprot:12192111-Ditylum_brightwellii.AAC.1